MNTVRPLPLSSEQHRSPAVERAAVPAARRQRRDRDFGVGYGSSSGYASGSGYAGGKRYGMTWKQPQVR